MSRWKSPGIPCPSSLLSGICLTGKGSGCLVLDIRLFVNGERKSMIGRREGLVVQSLHVEREVGEYGCWRLKAHGRGSIVINQYMT